MSDISTPDIVLRPLDSLDADHFKQLSSAPPCGGQVATLLLPMEKKGAETRKNRITFKNALGDLREQLEALGMKQGKLAVALRGLAPLDAPTHAFWQHQREGLAMILREDGRIDCFGLPFRPDAYVHLGETPYLRPLARLIGGFEAHVLVLDLDRVRLFRATRWRVEEMELQHTPLSLAEAMATDDPEKSLQQRTVSSSNLGGEGGATTAFHGHGITGDETRRKRARRFFEQVENGVRATIGKLELPLVLFGPDDEVGLYRSLNHHPKLCPGDIRFNASHLDRGRLDTMIRDWMAERDAAQRTKNLESLHAGLAKGGALDRIDEIVRAADNGRVSTLFLQTGARRFGVVDAEGATVHPQPEPGDEELLGRAVRTVASQGGDIHFLAADAMPDGRPAAALLRF
ncbi:hypothetical protein [Haloferula sargassicola]|uniref:Peptide chain release factor subunit 1 n=1 Tax=Haloferula sargassicola TaxID=490096 RepID=A0ABP9UN24_9BACT